MHRNTLTNKTGLYGEIIVQNSWNIVFDRNSATVYSYLEVKALGSKVSE